MKKVFQIILGALLIFFAFGNKALVMAADPHLFLSPSSGSNSASFPVEIKVDTGGKAAGGVDIHLEYPKNLLKIDNVVEGGAGKTAAFGELYSQIKNDEGKLRINAYFPTSAAGSSYTGNNGLIATVTFSPLASGTANVNFVCNSGSTTESNIVDKITVQDIIVCNSNVSGSYLLTYSGGTQATATPTPATSTTTSSEPTPTPPTPGSLTQTIGLIGIGILTLLTGLALAF